jgi:hypothetical protein
MSETRLPELIPILQVAIGPVILISGIGLLLLSMTNRLARVVDRTRLLLREERSLEGPQRETLHRQVEILYKRGRMVRSAILFAVLSVLFVAVLIALLFVSALFGAPLVPVLVLLFIAALICLIVSLVAFLQDVHLTLVALHLEMNAAGGEWTRRG